MRERTLLDTGPLVALLNCRDRYHKWAAAQWAQRGAPLLTCEAVLSEACFLLNREGTVNAGVIELVVRGSVAIAIDLEENVRPIGRLLGKYSDVPMSLADACLVRMAELHPDSTVMTLDSDFKVYRKHGRRVIPTIMPGDL